MDGTHRQRNIKYTYILDFAVLSSYKTFLESLLQSCYNQPKHLYFYQRSYMKDMSNLHYYHTDSTVYQNLEIQCNKELDSTRHTQNRYICTHMLQANHESGDLIKCLKIPVTEVIKFIK